MKKIQLLLGLCLLSTTSFYSQLNSECEKRTLFSMLSNHEIASCEIKDFDTFEFYIKDAKGNRSSIKKEGELTKTSYKWLGEWEKRPSNTQIYKNYENAVVKIGGKLIYDSNSGYNFTFKKAGETYWMNVMTDGSGYYYVTTLKEAKMQQDVVYSATEIKKNIDTEGQIAFYGIYFDTDKAILKESSTPTMNEIASFLKANPKMIVYLVGHTDNTGTYEHNIKLSKDRAIAVTTALIKTYNIPVNQISAEGVGSLSPITTNKTEEGKAKNRRVVMVLK